MATPLGHSIVGYTLARAAGVKSLKGLAASLGAACLPDIDFALGYVAHGDPLSLHREVITHKPAFPFLVGAATGLAAAGLALLRGRLPAPVDVLRPAFLATALVGSHLIMDPLPLPYDDREPRWASLRQVVVAQAWNAVVDLTVYGGLAFLVLSNGAAKEQAVQT